MTRDARETRPDIEQYRAVQSIAKRALHDLRSHITPDSTERTIAQTATSLLAEHGATETWYHGVHALVLLGSRSCLSVSGRDYAPSDEPVGDVNLVTVDLSPSVDVVWGDCARTFAVEGGACVERPQTAEFAEGLEFEGLLHREMRQFVTPATTFNELHTFANGLIAQHGWENLDFLSNLGHSIETKLGDRRFIAEGCRERLGDVRCFTFEPHIRKIGGEWGFKRENVYWLDGSGRAAEL